jgi:hypothetical protein
MFKGKFCFAFTGNIFHNWNLPGNKIIRVKAKDDNGIESFWSDPLPVSVFLIKILINMIPLNF